MLKYFKAIRTKRAVNDTGENYCLKELQLCSVWSMN